MAKFKTLRKKEKVYAFNFLDNLKDEKPAKVIFARFPTGGESFMPKLKNSVYDGIDLNKIVSKDNKELEKFTSSFIKYYSSAADKVDYEYFIRECVECFEDFESDGKQIKTVDDFLSLNLEMIALIADDCYKYANGKDEFSMGE